MSTAAHRPDRALPPALVERARAFVREPRAPVQARPAATVVLLRDGAGSASGGLEVYLLRRAASMAFAAGMHVFPGGTVDSRDVDRTVRWAGEPPEHWAQAFATDVPHARALVCAAVRETFEESGVLLAGPAGEPASGSPSGAVLADTGAEDWERDRGALVDRSLGFADLLDARGLQLRADLLRPWAHWITPEFESRRYDTRFFVAGLPPGQRPRDVSGEADRVTWVNVSEAVARHAQGEMAMLVPTIATLLDLQQYSSVAEVLDAGWSREIRPMMPRAVLDGERAWVVLPGEPGYADGVRA
ncbi:MAG: NUDIX hydrolase [Actinomycetes bacterium]